MNVSLRKIIKKFFFLAGYRPPKKIINVDGYIKKMINKPDEVFFYDLKELANFLSDTNSKCYYNELISRLINAYPQFEKSDFSFVGAGAGKYILNSYRMIVINNFTVFEKIYYSKADKLKSIEWFYSGYANRFNDIFTIPDLVSKYEGKVITALHYKYLPLESCRVSLIDIINASKKIKKIP